MLIKHLEKENCEPRNESINIKMSLEEEGLAIITENQGGHELKGDGHEAYLNRKQELYNRSMALPLSHFWSCKVFFFFIS